MPNSFASFWAATESSDNVNNTWLFATPHFGHTYDKDLLNQFRYNDWSCLK